MQSKVKNFRFTEVMCSDLDRLATVWKCTATEAVARALTQAVTVEDWKAYQRAQHENFSFRFRENQPGGTSTARARPCTSHTGQQPDRNHHCSRCSKAKKTESSGTATLANGQAQAFTGSYLYHWREKAMQDVFQL